MLLVDGANVVGSRPTGWWRDRAGAAQKLHLALSKAVETGRLSAPVVLVLEGAARSGVVEDVQSDLRVVHAAHNGDDTIASLVEQAAGGESVTVVTADRELRDRVERLGASVMGPRTLLDQLDQVDDPGGRSSRHDGG